MQENLKIQEPSVHSPYRSLMSRYKMYQLQEPKIISTTSSATLPKGPHIKFNQLHTSLKPIHPGNERLHTGKTRENWMHNC